jgi:hypothetical protein
LIWAQTVNRRMPVWPIPQSDGLAVAKAAATSFIHRFNCPHIENPAAFGRFAWVVASLLRWIPLLQLVPAAD